MTEAASRPGSRRSVMRVRASRAPSGRGLRQPRLARDVGIPLWRAPDASPATAHARSGNPGSRARRRPRCVPMSTSWCGGSASSASSPRSPPPAAAPLPARAPASRRAELLAAPQHRRVHHAVAQRLKLQRPPARPARRRKHRQPRRPRCRGIRRSPGCRTAPRPSSVSRVGTFDSGLAASSAAGDSLRVGRDAARSGRRCRG